MRITKASSHPRIETDTAFTKEIEPDAFKSALRVRITKAMKNPAQPALLLHLITASIACYPSCRCC
ncbi:hypothetical protein FUT69_04210 [Xylella taiwanensis]|uniref:Uncharacterized protein n=1 Tax=Xylella taiwanensis TaxID=1444770 RepID=Z9JGD2_9GAMM|nr:hypothetical protein [Xylella taiwanensis]AXI84403.1 hypothetical protein AB672_10920 [Xylella taiwanensis]EWS77038.1 hypothetical protein AF72_12990 [Xylella taiwanensis]MCD8455282.1 hypothetical protein [Xylella taiwanensis]MCD8457689.1 hypothetical protein [Xylella taiwanensis]MCD8459826.1 hypothetical protein [Xylella taiwanensis]